MTKVRVVQVRIIDYDIDFESDIYSPYANDIEEALKFDMAMYKDGAFDPFTDTESFPSVHTNWEVIGEPNGG